MAETPLSEAAANALAGTTDSDTDVDYPSIGETYYTKMYRTLNRILTIIAPVNELRVYKDGDLTYGVRGGFTSHGTNLYTYTASTANALTDDDDNFIYLVVTSGALVLTVSTTAFPDPGVTAHLPLATIAVGSESAAAVSSKYDPVDIVDYRGRAIYELIG